MQKKRQSVLMTFENTCCTCAALLSSTPPGYDENPVNWHSHKQSLGCCGRIICSQCIRSNKRFANYCPFCQISFVPSSLPPGLRDPPTYSPPSSPQAQVIEQGEKTQQELPPTYDEHVNSRQSALADPKNCQAAEDVLHFVNPEYDSIASLSLKYGVPADVLKRKNDIFADHLLTARRCILIPGEYYSAGISFSPQPVEGEEEDLKKGKIRKWMMACKVADYDIAQFYLKETHFHLEQAINDYKRDEEWENLHPRESSSSGKLKQKRTLMDWRTAANRSR